LAASPCTPIRFFKVRDFWVCGARGERRRLVRAPERAEGVPEASIEVEAQVDLRYLGQSFELRVPAEGPSDSWAQAFHTSHEQRYGYARRDRGIEAVTLRATARGPGRELLGARLESSSDLSTNPSGSGRVWLEGAMREVPVIHRSDLESGSGRTGPLVVIDDSATTWVPSGFQILAHDSGVLRLRRPSE